MSVHIEHITFLGEPAVRVTTSQLEGIIVPGWGSNLISLIWRPDGTALLRTPESAEAYLARTALYGVPVLFPPNRIDRGSFTFQGREYRFPLSEKEKDLHIHGVLRHIPWNLSRTETEGETALVETSVVSEDAPDVYAAFPHKFTVRQQFRFSADAVEIRFILESRDEAAMPWGVGYHTTLNLPLAKDGSLERCTVQLPVAKSWVLSDRLMPTGELVDYEHGEAMRRGIRPTGLQLDDVLFVDPNEPSEAVITDEVAGLRVTYTADQAFKHWVLYNGDPATSGFFCPEPYTWVTNAPNLDLPDDVTGVQVLEPGSTASVSTRIAVSKL